MKLDAKTIITLATVILMKADEALKDDKVTVQEAYQFIGEIIKQLGLENKVLFHKN